MDTKTLAAIIAAVALLLAIPLVVQLAKGQHQPAAAVAAPPQITEPVPSAVAAPASPNRAAFRSIHPGMTYAECVALIGVEGQYRGMGAHGMQQYRWSFPDGIYEELYFRDGRVAGGGNGRE